MKVFFADDGRIETLVCRMSVTQCAVCGVYICRWLRKIINKITILMINNTNHDNNLYNSNNHENNISHNNGSRESNGKNAPGYYI